MAFWKSVFSEADGSGSFSRVAGGVSVLVGLGWGSDIVYHAVKVGQTPNLTAVTEFILALLSPYGLNKTVTVASQAVTSIFAPKPPQS